MGLNCAAFNATIRQRFDSNRAAGNEISALTPPFAASLPTLRVTWREVGLWLASIAICVLGVVWLAAGDLTGLLPLAAGISGALLVHRRLLPVCIWLGAAGWAAVAFLHGSTPALVLVAVALASAGLAAWRGGRLEATTTRPTPSAAHTAALLAVAAPSPAEAHQTASAVLPAAAAVDGDAAGLEAASTALVIRTIRRFQVLDAGGRDLTRALLRKRVLCFLWLHVLIRSLDSRSGRVLKDTLANESAPGLDAGSQRDNFRRQLWDMTHELPGPIARGIRSDEEHVWLDFADCSVDVLQLRGLVQEAKAASQLLTIDLQTRIQATLSEVGAGDFLEIWEELERRATRAKRPGEPSPKVLALRAEADANRSSLAAALGVSLQAQGALEEAVQWLREAVRLDSGRGDLVPRVVAIYLQLNQGARAEEFRHKYESGEEV
jgi:hypothetical protein